MQVSLLVLAAAAVLASPALGSPAAPGPARVPGTDDNRKWTSGQAFGSSVLGTTNRYRREHEARDVGWNATLAGFAAAYLEESQCAFRHSGGPYGENIACGYATPAVAVAAWGDEGAAYDFNRPGFSHATGHFTQLVWKGTTDVGCARKWCGEDMRWYLACEYWPRGNVYGQFEENVGRLGQ